MEYAGYQQRTPIDWQKIFQDAASKVTGVMEERQKEREALDDEMANAVNSTYDYTATKSPTFNDFILTSADSTRNYIMEQNRLLKAGQITPSEYKRRVSNSKDSWSRFSDVTKSFDKNIAEMMDRDAKGESSGFENFLLGSTMQMSDLTGMQMVQDPMTGRGVLRRSDGMIYDLQSMAQVMGQRYDKVDVFGEVNQKVKLLGQSAYTSKDGVTTKKDKLIGKAKPSIVNAVLSDDTRAGSILVDYMDGYSFTYDESKVNDKTILVKNDQNGIPRAQLNSKQRKAAESFVSNIIDSELSSYYSAGTPGESGTGGVKQAFINTRNNDINTILSGGMGTDAGIAITNASGFIPPKYGGDSKTRVLSVKKIPSQDRLGFNVYAVDTYSDDRGQAKVLIPEKELRGYLNDAFNKVSGQGKDIPTQVIIGQSGSQAGAADSIFQ
jgi:hypothetical protein